MNSSLITLLQGFHLSFVFKIVTLTVLGLFLIFTFVLMTQIRSLNNIVKVYAHHASALVTFFALFYFLLTVALFIGALVIL